VPPAGVSGRGAAPEVLDLSLIAFAGIAGAGLVEILQVLQRRNRDRCVTDV